jgi:RNA polymerase sigma-70 factor (ECF subfamily)
MAATVIEHPDARVEILLRKAKEGSHDSFADLIAVHESMVFSISLHALRDRVVAEETAQEVFLQLYRHLQSIESGSHLTAWLRRATTNRCIDELRRQSPSVTLDDAIHAPAAIEQHDHFLHDRLKNLVADLPEKQRLALILRYQEGLDPSEISSVVDLPVNTVKSHLRRALATLRLHLGMNREQAGTARLSREQAT